MKDPFIVLERKTGRGISILSSCKGHVKIIFLPVIALSFPHLCPKLEQTLHKNQEQHS